MKDAATIKRAVDRAAQAITLRASLGQGTASTKATLREGLSCDVEEGAFRFVVGMHEGYGGVNEGPNPGVVGRAALASCLAIGIGMWAARMEVPLDALEVVVEADYDARGELGVSPDVAPGYSAMRYDIRVKSPAPEAQVRAMLETAVRTSSFVDNFARALPVSGEVHVSRS